MLYIINILDAYRNAERFNRNEEIKDAEGTYGCNMGQDPPYLLISPGTFLLIFVSCISINIYVWSSIYKLQFIQRASETHIRMGWFR